MTHIAIGYFWMCAQQTDRKKITILDWAHYYQHEQDEIGFKLHQQKDI